MLPCRCSQCGARRSLRRPPDQYIRPPKCKCGRHKAWRVDWYRVKIERSRNLCNCHGYWFIHAKGRGWCIFNTGPTPLKTHKARESAYCGCPAYDEPHLANRGRCFITSPLIGVEYHHDGDDPPF